MTFKVSIIDAMNVSASRGEGSMIYFRLISLWILCEAMLGGIIHGLRIPVSGLIVGSSAVICICLIAWYVPEKGAILKATIIVCVFKMILSPQAPAPAYIAVLFQGLLGELLFWRRRFFLLSCLLLAILSLLESGLQRILVLTIVYGNDLWGVINEALNRMTGQERFTNYSLIIGLGYTGLHLVTGIIVGLFAASLPGRIEKWKLDPALGGISKGRVDSAAVEGKRKTLKRGLFIIWVVLILLYVQSYYQVGQPLLSPNRVLKLFLRSLIIILSWYFLVGPVLKMILYRWLSGKKAREQAMIRQVMDILPSTRYLVIESWKKAGERRGLKRILLTIKIILANSFGSPRKIVILTGPIGSGKTESLLAWTKGRTDVHGILSPVRNGLRMFMEIDSGKLFPMEAEEGETETIAVGKFIFSKKSFEKAIDHIRKVMNKDGWLVIDEVGPVELRGEGFAGVLKEALTKGEGNLLIVVRSKEDMVEKIKNYFGLNGAIVIEKIEAEESFAEL